MSDGFVAVIMALRMTVDPLPCLQVAIYGKDFITAAKDTWALFKARGFDVLINDVSLASPATPASRPPLTPLTPLTPQAPFHL
jgi:hypothetical protein